MMHGMARNMPSYGLYHPHQSNFFGGLDDSMLARVEALAAVGDMTKNNSPPMVKQDTGLYAEMTPPPASRSQMTSLHTFGESMLDQISAASIPALTSMNDVHASHVNVTHNQMYSPVYSHNMGQGGGPPFGQHHALSHHSLPPHSMHDLECDPRELEAFAERFKQRRIKLGVTQADVGNALGNLKLPGVGSLSQSTICRFESLTLSHNNMIALKPVLQAWLEDAERAAREKKQAGDGYGSADKKRKRTSIAAPEKRSLEAYFAVQPRPSGEKIAQIAEKLDLKKNVVRVWFCNQRQKQKRMKFSAQNH